MKIKLFQASGLKDLMMEKKNAIHQEIFSKENWMLQGSNEKNLEISLIEQHSIELPIFDFDGISASVKDEPVSDKDGVEVMARVVRYHVPFTGGQQDQEILEFSPVNTKSKNDIPLEAEIKNTHYLRYLIFQYNSFDNDPAFVSKSFNQDLESFKTRFDHLADEVIDFNEKLKPLIQSKIDEQQHTQNSLEAFATCLGVPRFNG